MVLDLKPCCCNCQHFLPPWWVAQGLTPGRPDKDGDPVRCAHADVCGRFLAAKEFDE